MNKKHVSDGNGCFRCYSKFQLQKNITQFSAPTADSLDGALSELADEGMQALVLDLRNNPGGLLNSAITVSEKFLKAGDLIVTTRGRGDMYKQSLEAAHTGRYTDLPLAIGAGDVRMLDLFFALGPSPQRVELTYADADGEHVLVIDTREALLGLHIPDQAAQAAAE